jgi:hypothetical protein
MKLQQIQEDIDRLDIKDARIMELTSRDSAGELFIRLSYTPGKVCHSLSFTGCSKINLQYRRGDNALFSIKEYFFSKIPCFVQKVRISPAGKDRGGFQFVLDLNPLEVTVICKEFAVKNRAGETLFSVRNESSKITCVDLTALDARRKSAD